MTPASPPTNLASRGIQEQIQFATHVYENLQAMIRLADAKAGVVLTLLLFLGYTTFSWLKDALERVTWKSPLYSFFDTILISATLSFVGGLVLTLIYAWRVVAPRYGKRSLQSGRDLFFHSDITAFCNSDAYLAALQNASSELILSNLSSAVYEVAKIAELKLENVSAMNRLVVISIFSWATSMVACIALFYLERK